MSRILQLTALILLLASTCPAQQSTSGDSAKLLDHLAGRWVMTGTLGARQTTHDVDAELVLKGEYLRFHEVSREKDSHGAPAYEAIVFLSWNAKLNQYTCMWLDNTAGGGLSPQGIALGPKAGDSVPLVFTLSPHESLHTTFSYDAPTDSWRLTIDDVTDGKSDRYGDVKLTRAGKPITRSAAPPPARCAKPTTKDRWSRRTRSAAPPPPR